MCVTLYLYILNYSVIFSELKLQRYIMVILLSESLVLCENALYAFFVSAFQMACLFKFIKEFLLFLLNTAFNLTEQILVQIW